jgi:multidrug efflux system membrane fusion protein
VLIGIIVAAAASVWLTTKGVPDVTLYEVNAQNVSQYIGGGGIIFPRQQLDVSYPVAERVVAVPVKAGDQVTLNQPLIQLDPSQLNAQIKQASDDMDAARAYLNTVTLNGNTIAIAQAQQAYNISRDRYNELVAEAMSPLVNKGNLISPMNGVVTTVDVNPGQVFAANTTLLTIMDESSVIVHVKVPLSNFAAVHLGQSAIVTPSALPDLNAQGVVKSIIPQADPQTDTFEVWVEVVNTDKHLLPGMSAFVRIQGSNQAFGLPRVAVLNSDHAPTVFVVRNQHAHLRAVRVVGHSSNTVFVGSGLSKGDKVVVVGVDTLHDGQAVHVARVEG